MMVYLHSDLGQVDLQRQLLAAVHVGVVGPVEGALQLVQLEGGEGGPVPAVLLLGVVLLLLLLLLLFLLRVLSACLPARRVCSRAVGRTVRGGGGAAHTWSRRRWVCFNYRVYVVFQLAFLQFVSKLN